MQHPATQSPRLQARSLLTLLDAQKFQVCTVAELPEEESAMCSIVNRPAGHGVITLQVLRAKLWRLRGGVAMFGQMIASTLALIRNSRQRKESQAGLPQSDVPNDDVLQKVENLNFRTHGSEIRLAGQVTHLSLKQDAERAVREVAGATHVVNDIEVLRGRRQVRAAP